MADTINEVHPMTDAAHAGRLARCNSQLLNEVTDAAQKAYISAVEKAQQVRDETVRASLGRFRQSLKVLYAAI